MQTKSLIQRLAVCSWSLHPANPEELIAQLQAIGINRVQLALDPLRTAPEVWGDTPARLQQHGIAVVSGMFGCVGEDYTTLETIKATGGLAPDGTWDENWKNIQSTAELADRLGLKLVTFHAGFLPHDENDPAFSKLLKRLEMVADVFATRQIALGLETGQETAATLDGVLQRLGRPNVGVNFDPANMILYGKGDPVEAVRLLASWVRQVHIKDARGTTVPGTWGTEVPVGEGDVDWRGFFAELRAMNFGGDCCIEREAGSKRIPEIRATPAFLESVAR